MKLDDAQRSRVAAWIQEGLKLSEIQNRINTDLGLRLTYMEVRFLVDDLKLTPKDVERPKDPAAIAAAGKQGSTQPTGPTPTSKPAGDPLPEAAPQPAAGVSVTVDQLARPGAMVSGKVTFSDGNKADWYIDQTGRLGLSPQLAGYRPSPGDLQQFQILLESEFSKMGF
jgi:hypothetical protein